MLKEVEGGREGGGGSAVLVVVTEMWYICLGYSKRAELDTHAYTVDFHMIHKMTLFSKLWRGP